MKGETKKKYSWWGGFLIGAGIISFIISNPIAGAILIAIGVYLITEGKKIQGKQKVEKKNTRKLKGVRGWLLFYVVVFIMDLILLIFYTTSEIFDIVSSVFFWVVGVLSLILIFRHSSKAPLWNLIYLWASVAIVILYYLLDLSWGYSGFDLISGLIYALIWIIYWRKSKRVKNTFGNNGKWTI